MVILHHIPILFHDIMISVFWWLLFFHAKLVYCQATYRLYWVNARRGAVYTLESGVGLKVLIQGDLMV